MWFEIKVFATIIMMVFVVMLVIAFIIQTPNRIHTEEALQRFAEQMQVEREDVELIRKSNSSRIFGDPRDVTFELEIEGSPWGGKCTSGFFSKMVCRVYAPGAAQ